MLFYFLKDGIQMEEEGKLTNKNYGGDAGHVSVME